MSANPDGVDVSNVIVLLVDDTEAARRAGAWALGAARRQQAGLLPMQSCSLPRSAATAGSAARSLPDWYGRPIGP
jgi:hypothetical protein